MAAAVALIGALLVCVIGWCLSHAQRCADRDARVIERLTRLEEKIR